MAKDMTSDARTRTGMPDFVMVGGQRCGSTWTQRALMEHPEVFVPPRRAGIELTEGQLRGYGGQRLIGTFDAELLYDEQIPLKLSRQPEAPKVIVQLRNPVDRAYSWYVLQRRRGDGIYSKQITFEEALKTDDIILDRGRYFKYLAPIVRSLPAHRILILLQDDLATDPRRFLDRICTFLQVDRDFVPSTMLERVNPATRTKSVTLHQVLRRGKRLTRLVTRNDWLVHRMETSRLVESVRRWNERAVPAMRQETRAALQEYYRDEVSQLSGLIGRDLSAWLT